MVAMKLANYLEADGNSATKLAKAVGVAVSTITRAAKGEIIPSHKLMSAIYEKTDGKVTPSDFYDFAA